MRRVTLELFLRQAHRFCVGAAIDHAVIAGVGALALSAAAGLGGFLVGAGGTAGTTVIGIAAMDIDADVLVITITERFRFILARGKNALAIDTFFEFRTGDKTAARSICAAELCACVGIDARTVADHFTRLTGVFALALSADFFFTAFGVDGTASVMCVFFTDCSLFVVVKGAGEMVSRHTLFSKAFFAKAVAAFPARHLCAVIGVCAAVGHIIGFAFARKEMFCVFACDFTRSCFCIALRRFLACLRDLPFFGHTFGKRVFVTFPCIVCAFRSGDFTQAFFCIALRMIWACLDDFPFSGFAFGQIISVTRPSVVWATGFAARLACTCCNIAECVFVADVDRFPFARNAFGKCVSVTFPCAV